MNYTRVYHFALCADFILQSHPEVAEVMTAPKEEIVKRHTEVQEHLNRYNVLTSSLKLDGYVTPVAQGRRASSHNKRNNNEDPKKRRQSHVSVARIYI